MTHARHVAREEMGLEQLRLAVRGGTGLEFLLGAGLGSDRPMARHSAVRARRRS
jgi:hypothetical protein